MAVDIGARTEVDFVAFDAPALGGVPVLLALVSIRAVFRVVLGIAVEDEGDWLGERSGSVRNE